MVITDSRDKIPSPWDSCSNPGLCSTLLPFIFFFSLILPPDHLYPILWFMYWEVWSLLSLATSDMLTGACFWCQRAFLEMSKWSASRCSPFIYLPLNYRLDSWKHCVLLAAAHLRVISFPRGTLGPVPESCIRGAHNSVSCWDTEPTHTQKVVIAFQQSKGLCVFGDLCQDKFLKIQRLFILFPFLFLRSQPTTSLAAVRLPGDVTWPHLKTVCPACHLLMSKAVMGLVWNAHPE